MHEIVTSIEIRPAILDGALGTMLESRGIDTSGKSWTARSILSNPDLIVQLHSEYIKAGAEIVTANTFRTNSRALHGTGLDPESLTKEAVRLAQKARDSNSSNVRIAGSLAPVEDCFRPELSPANDEALLREHRQMVLWLLQAQIDFFLIETISTIREALCALKAVTQETDREVYVSVVPKNSKTMLDGTPLESAVELLARNGAHLVALNCAPLSTTLSALPGFATAAKHSGIMFGCYPNASEQRPDGSWDLNASDDPRVVECMNSWLEQGAMLIGSCCGTTPHTTSLLRKARDQRFVNP